MWQERWKPLKACSLENAIKTLQKIVGCCGMETTERTEAKKERAEKGRGKKAGSKETCKKIIVGCPKEKLKPSGKDYHC